MTNQIILTLLKKEKKTLSGLKIKKKETSRLEEETKSLIHFFNL